MSTKHTHNEGAEVVTEVISKSEAFFTNYGKKLIYGITAIVILAGAYLAYYKFVQLPNIAEAQEQLFPAEEKFRAEEYELALNGDGNILGFAQVIEDYGKKAGEAVYFYAGVCELQLGNFENAISYLKSYKGDNSTLKARATACIGDAYVELNELEKSLTYFEEAAEIADNSFAAAYLLKAGIVSEELGNNEDAIKYYKQIKDNYSQSYEGYEIDKYISRIEAK